jgi:beta-xylosidase
VKMVQIKSANRVTTAKQEKFAPQISDEFDNEKLGLQWQWCANHRDDWFSLSARPGWLRLYPLLTRPSLNQQENLLLQKLPARSFVAETQLSLFPAQWGEEAGMAVVGKSEAALGLQHNGQKNRVVLRINDEIQYLAETRSSTMKIRLAFDEGGRCSFGFEENGDFVPIQFQATKGTWIGARVGFYSVKRVENSPAGWADFDYLRFA